MLAVLAVDAVGTDLYRSGTHERSVQIDQIRVERRGCGDGLERGARNVQRLNGAIEKWLRRVGLQFGQLFVRRVRVEEWLRDECEHGTGTRVNGDDRAI